MLPKENEVYDSLFLQFVRAVVRKELGHEFNMPFVYTSRQKGCLEVLVEHLRQDAREGTEASGMEVLSAYRAFCWTLVHSLERESQQKWGNPIQRFLWLKALRGDGSFLPAKDVTPILAQLKHFRRLVTPYEGIAHSDALDPSEDSVRHVGRLYGLVLQLGKAAPFNMICELQQFVSSLVYSQVADPHVYVDPKYEWISIGTETLHLQRL
ncbi:hypothetical protein HD554DRAFT_2176883 [Boletus coccyginus]|nr:hypothetical protein HD554DRAFT_2176883 [Boletus coccyginus]